MPTAELIRTNPLLEIWSLNPFACIPERYPPGYTSCQSWVDLCIIYCNCFLFSEVSHKISHWFDFLLTSATCLVIIDSFIHSFIIIFWIMNIWRWWGIVYLLKFQRVTELVACPDSRKPKYACFIITIQGRRHEFESLKGQKKVL